MKQIFLIISLLCMASSTKCGRETEGRSWYKDFCMGLAVGSTVTLVKTGATETLGMTPWPHDPYLTSVKSLATTSMILAGYDLLNRNYSAAFISGLAVSSCAVHAVEATRITK